MEYNVAILGATGAVGMEMLKVLQEREFPVKNLRLLASGRSAGQKVNFRGQELVIEEATDDAFAGMDLVLGAAENDIAKRFAPAIRKAGAVFVDNSSAFRLHPQVPLVVPEVNGEDVKNHEGIISNPNCSTIITLTAIAALAKLSPIASMVVSTYQAVSGAGVEGIRQLEREMNEESVPLTVFPYPISCNLIPQIGSHQEEGYTSEEMKLQYEGRKILHLPELKVNCTCVRVPVMRSHSISATIRFRDEVTVEQARQAIAAAPGCKLVDDLDKSLYPMPLDTSNQDLVYVGRIRKDLTDPKGLTLWCCGDQIRKGAATNAVQIGELVCGIKK